MNRFIKSLFVAGAMVTGVFASAKDVNVNNAVALEKTEQTTKNVVKTVAEDDGAICVGTGTLIIEEDENSITIIEIIKVVCVFY